ncbi:MAG TPA: sodium:phosphate symporter [Desulfobulbaceae bacterium]|nr:sodium:phosphate symporter [Desulfobulbaceae bacterium]
MNETFDLWKLLAGLGIFLFGMHQLEDAVKALSGKAFRKVISHYTNGRLRSIGSGFLVTSILQVSSAVSLMVLAFVGAGIMSMENAVGVIMGANVGTTATAWIVAFLGFKLNIETFALPLIGVGGILMVLFGTASRIFQASRLLIGFGFLFLGLDYMKGSVEILAEGFDLSSIPNYGPWFYVLIGALFTGLMQSSSASIALVLTALHGGLITFAIGAAMIIGANIGTTFTVLLGAVGGIPSKKRVALSHLIFNMVTAVVALLGIRGLIALVEMFFDIQANSVMALALFHTLFNLLGVLLFLPFIGPLARLLVRIFPDRKAILTVFIDKTPAEVVDAAIAALKKEINHMLEECQLYNLRALSIDEKLVFDHDLPFEKNLKKKFTLEDLYENIKLLHSEIFAFYSRLHTQKLDESETKELERLVFASRNIMNSIKNFKGIRYDFDEFDCSENAYMNTQYKLFRRRLVESYHNMNRILGLETKEEQYRELLKAFVHIEETDKKFIRETMDAVSASRIHDMEIASLLLVNRLFTQACRLQVFGMKDLLLSHEQINDFDRAMDVKDIMDEEKAKAMEKK